MKVFWLSLMLSLGIFTQGVRGASVVDSQESWKTFTSVNQPSSTYSILPSKEFTEGTGTSFTFGTCNAELKKDGRIEVQSPSAYRVIAFEWIDPSLFVKETQISIPLNEMFYAPGEESEPTHDLFSFLGNSTEGTLITIYEPVKRQSTGAKEVLGGSRPVFATSKPSSQSSSQSSQRKEGVKRETESMASYESWKTPAPIYERASYRKLPNYLGPAFDPNQSERLDSSILVRSFKWTYYDLPWAIVDFFVKTPFYILLIVFLLFFFAIISLMGIFGMISKRN